MLTYWRYAMNLRLILAIVMLTMVSNVSAQQNPLPDEIVITYITRNKPLKTVLEELSAKSGVPINFTPKRIPANSKVTINAVNQTLGTILRAVLKPRKCTYDIIGNSIVVSRDKLRPSDRDLTISGYLTDRESGERLVAANVYLFDKSKGTQTNEYGFYTFTMDKGTKRLYYSYLGYGQEVKEIFLQRDTVMDIELAPDALLNEIVILDDVENQEEPRAVSESKLHIERIRTASTLGGEADVIRLVGLMPGVDSGADGMGGINVRGGSADQNLVLLDGVPVYNANHALGLFSVFNSNVIKDATLIKGNIPARYGGRLSSILDIRTRDGNANKLSGDATLSALAVKGSLEGPIGSGGSTFIFSGRRTFLDPWIKAITSFTNENAGKTGFSTYHFLDLNAKLRLKLGKKHTLYLSGFYGKDDFDTNQQSVQNDPSSGFINNINTETAWDWGNNLASIRLTSQFSQKAFGRMTAYYTKYEFDSFEFDEFKSTDTSFLQRRVYKAGYYKSAIQDLSVQYDFDYIPNPVHTFRMGAGVVSHIFKPGLVSINTADNVFSLNDPIIREEVQLLINEPNLTGMEYSVYAEDEISLGYATTLHIGLHTNMIRTNGQSYLSVQPRVSFLAKWESAYFRAGVSRMNQYLHLLSSNGLGLPTDVWLPSTDRLGPEKSWIGSAGVGYYNSAGIRFGIEGYYKLFDALTTFDEGGFSKISSEVDWESEIPVGTGRAYGLETFLNKIIGRSTWTLNYTLAFSLREFEGLNINDEPFPFRYNRRHNVKFGLLHKITQQTEFALNWNMSSGNPITEPAGNVILGDNGEIQVIYLEKNGGLLPSYNRLDIGFNFYSKYSWGRTKFSLGVYNAFNRANPFYRDIETTVENPNRFQVVDFSILPVIPSVAYSVSF